MPLSGVDMSRKLEVRLVEAAKMVSGCPVVHCASLWSRVRGGSDDVVRRTYGAGSARASDITSGADRAPHVVHVVDRTSRPDGRHSQTPSRVEPLVLGESPPQTSGLVGAGDNPEGASYVADYPQPADPA